MGPGTTNTGQQMFFRLSFALPPRSNEYQTKKKPKSLSAGVNGNILTLYELHEQRNNCAVL